jgi:hypothetical protein
MVTLFIRLGVWLLLSINFSVPIFAAFNDERVFGNDRHESALPIESKYDQPEPVVALGKGLQPHREKYKKPESAHTKAFKEKMEQKRQMSEKGAQENIQAKGNGAELQKDRFAVFNKFSVEMPQKNPLNEFLQTYRPKLIRSVLSTNIGKLQDIASGRSSEVKNKFEVQKKALIDRVRQFSGRVASEEFKGDQLQERQKKFIAKKENQLNAFINASLKEQSQARLSEDQPQNAKIPPLVTAEKPKESWCGWAMNVLKKEITPIFTGGVSELGALGF